MHAPPKDLHMATVQDSKSRDFLIAKNPNPNSRLPYIIRLPVAGGEDIVLACGSDWPGVKDVFCYQLDSWPDGAEVLERVPVASCWRTGKAVHLVLRRRMRRRSMFVWVQSKGRTLIFWRTQKTMQTARPGLKVPQARRLSGSIVIAVDIREKYPWRFTRQGAECTRRELPVGDYGIIVDGKLCAAVERKTPEGLLSSALDGTLNFALAELSRLPHGLVVVEGRFADLFRTSEYVDSGWVMSVVAALQVTYPRVSWTFADTRDLAEEFAYRWLAAAYKAITDPGSPLYDERKSGDMAGADAVAESKAPTLLAPPTVRDRQGRIEMALKLAEEGHQWTSADYARYFDVTQQTAWLDLRYLVDAGALVAVGSPRYRRYVRPQQGE